MNLNLETDLKKFLRDTILGIKQKLILNLTINVSREKYVKKLEML